MKYFAKSCCILPVLLCAAGATQAQEGSVDTLHRDGHQGLGQPGLSLSL